MPKKTSTPFPKGYSDWNYNWNQVYKNVYVETLSLNNLFPNDKRLSYDKIQRIDALLDNENDIRPTPNLIISENMNKVLCKESVDNYYEAETREKEQAKVQALREIVGDFCAALDEKQIEIAAVDPEGASLLRMMRDKADFALRDYGLEAMNDYSYSMIESQEGAIHMPDGSETDPMKKDFTRNIDEISDLPYLPVYENTSRMVRIACDHAIAARAGTLTEQQDRLSRKLLLTQYDQVSAGIEETLRVTGDNSTKDFQRWAAVMDNPPSDLGVYERGAFRVPFDMEGRRIALRQGWPVEDAAMLGSLFVIHSQMTNPLRSTEKFLPSVQTSFEALLQEISSTRISSSEIRTEKLNHVFDFLSQNEKNLHLKNGSMGAFVDHWKRIKIQPCQYLSAAELDEAAREYDRRKALPRAAGSDGSPVGYYEQILAGTEVYSRLSDLAQRIAPVNRGGKDLPEYDFMRNGLTKLIGMISAFYGPDASAGKQRQKDMAQIENAHEALSDLAQTYLNAVRKNKKEPAFKKAAAEELRDYCAQLAKTAAATEIGLEAAEARRAQLDWRKEKDQEKNREKDAYQKYLDEVWTPYLEAVNTPVADAYDYKAVAERGYHIDDLTTKLGAVKEIIYNSGMSLEQSRSILREALPEQEADSFYQRVLDDVLRAGADATIYNRVLKGTVKKSSVTADEKWKKLPDQQKKARAAEIIQGMIDGKYYDREIFIEYANDAERQAIAVRFLSLETITRTMTVRVITELERRSPAQALEVFRHLPDVLYPGQLGSILSKLDADPIIHDTWKKTFLQEEKKNKIEQMREKIRTEEQEPGRREALLRALDGAENILSVPTPEAKRAAEAKEHVGTNAANAYKPVLFQKERQNAAGRRIERNGKPISVFGGVLVLPDATNESVKNTLQTPELPEKTKNAILRMLHKMDEMEMLPKDRTETNEEERAKVYGYRKIQAAKQAYREAVENGNIAEIEKCREDYDREYRNMEELLAIAKEGFGGEYYNTPDMFVTRNPFDFPWDQLDTPHQGQINTVFLMYQQMNRFHMTPEEILPQYANAVIRNWHNTLTEKCESMLNGKDFASTMELLMSRDAAGDLDGGNYRPPTRCLPLYWTFPDAEGFDRDGGACWAQDAEQLFLDTYNREVLPFDLLNKRDGDMLGLRGRSIQNLIAVNDADRDYRKLIGMPNYNKDMELEAPFSLQDYIRTHEIDPDAMQNRLNVMLNAASKSKVAPFREELVAGGLAVCLQVLELKKAERDTDWYRDMEDMARSLRAELPQLENNTIKQGTELEALDTIFGFEEQLLQTLQGFDRMAPSFQPERSAEEKGKSAAARGKENIEGSNEEKPKVEENVIPESRSNEVKGGEPAPENLQSEEPKVEENEVRESLSAEAGLNQSQGNEVEGGEPELENLRIDEEMAKENAAAESQNGEPGPDQSQGNEVEGGEDEFENLRIDEEMGKDSEVRESLNGEPGPDQSQGNEVEGGEDEFENLRIDEEMDKKSEVRESLNEKPGLDRSNAREPQDMGAAGEEAEPRAEQAAERIEAFGQFTAELENAGLAAGADDPFDAIRMSVQRLRELAGPLMTRQPDGALPKLSPEQRTELQAAYQLVSNVSRAFRTYAEDLSNPAYAKAVQAAARIETLAAEDLNVLTGERGKNAENLAELYSKRRLVVDIGGQNSVNLGTQENPRNTLRFTMPDGRAVNGVFTPDRPLRSMTEELNTLKQRAQQSPDNPNVQNADVLLGYFEKSAKVRDALLSMDENGIREMQRLDQASIFNNWTYNHRYDDLAVEATHDQIISLKLIHDIAENDYADYIDSYLLDRAGIISRGKLCEAMQIQPGQPMEARAAAMSAVAEALGVGSLTAACRPVTVTQNGRKAQGWFMENGKGSDCRNPADGDALLQADRSSRIAQNAVRDMAALQVLDFICGNADRSRNNLRFQVSMVNGAAELGGIQAVDNSMCFMGCTMNTDLGGNRKLEELKTIPKSMADRVMALDGNSLKELLQQYRLPELQIDRAVNRLNAVQDRIRLGAEYFKDKDINAVSDDCIHVVPDGDYGKLSMDRVNDMPIKRFWDGACDTARQSKREEELRKLGNTLRQDERELLSFYNQLLDADKGVYFSSKEYGAIKTALHKLSKQHSDLTGAPLTKQEEKAGLPVHKPTQEELQSLENCYVTLSQAIVTYTNRKKEQYQNHKLDKKGLERHNLAARISKKLQAQWNHMAELPGKLDAIQRLYPAKKQAAAAVRTDKLLNHYNLTERQRLQDRQVREKAGAVTYLTPQQRMEPVLAALSHQGSLYLDNESRTMSREKIADALYNAFTLTELGAACGPDKPVTDAAVRNVNTLIRSKADTGLYKDSDARLKGGPAGQQNKGLMEASAYARLHKDQYQLFRDAVRATLSTLEERKPRQAGDPKEASNARGERKAEPVYLNRLVRLLKKPDNLMDELSRLIRDVQAEKDRQKELAANEEMKQQQNPHEQNPRQEKPSVGQPKDSFHGELDPEVPFSIGNRLRQLNKVFDTQRENRTLKRNELREMLMDAYAMTELHSATGNWNFDLDEDTKGLMRKLLTKNSPQEIRAGKDALSEEVNLNVNALHTDSYAAARQAINATMRLSEDKTETAQMKELFDLFKNPDSLQQKLPDFAAKVTKLLDERLAPDHDRKSNTMNNRKSKPDNLKV